MAEKISVQIALEGGAEIQRQLADIGEAGQKAFADIAKSAEQVGGFANIKPDAVTEKLKAMGLEGTAAFDKITKAVSSAANLEKVVTGVQSIETAFVALGRAAGPIGLAIAAAFQAAAKSTIAFAESINKASDQAVKLGLSLEQFKKLREELAKVGISAQGAASGIEEFQKKLGTPRTDVIDVLTATGNVLRFVGETSNSAAKELPKFLEQLSKMPDSAQRTQLALDNLGKTAGTEFIQGLRAAEGSMSADERKAYELGQAINKLSQTWAEFGSVALAPTLTAGLNALTQGIQTVNAALAQNPWGTWIGAAQAALNPLVALIDQVGSKIANLASQLTGIDWGTISSGATAAWNAVSTAVQQAGQAISTFVSSLGSITWDAIASAGVAAWNAIAAAIQGVIDKVMQFLGLKSQAGGAPAGGGGGGEGMAGGGLIGGRGTGTSDSNLAWVSRGEHIMPARAVAQPGVLAFLEALRRSGGNLRSVLDGMGRFALGGLVPRAVPAFAGGGPVGGMSHVTIQFPGLPPIAGLRASSDVVGELQRAAAMAQVRSGGRKPSRYS